MNSKISNQQQPTTDEQAIDEQAIESLNDYTGIYYSLVVVQYKLSRQQSKSIKDSLNDAHKKVCDTCTGEISYDRTN